MDIIITPRLTLRPPWPQTRDFDRDDIAAFAPAQDIDAVLDGAAHIILRERAIGWIDAKGVITLGAAWKGRGLEIEIARAFLHHARGVDTPVAPASVHGRPVSLSLAC